MNPGTPPAFDRGAFAAALRWLADHGVFLGTSSWKYEGWLGQVYTPDHYATRGKFSQARFERECLREYAETFPTVCVDAGYYRFPSPKWIAEMMEATPPAFQFTFKVTDDITARTFPNLPRHGDKAGRRNEHFLDAELFDQGFITPLTPWREKCGVLIFEFSHFHPRDFSRGREFMEALHGFLGALPKGWRYAVEIRNRNFLQPDYFAMLREHGVAHVFNAWTKMPPIGEQMALEGSLNCAGFQAARLLLKQGRTYEEAVNMFQPYRSLKEPNEETRDAAGKLIQYALNQKNDPARPKAFIYVNNRLEGNALLTLVAILASLGIEFPLPPGAPGPTPQEPPSFSLK